MPRKLYGVLNPDGRTIHVVAFSAKLCKDEFVRPFARYGESLDKVWEDAKADGYRCLEFNLTEKKQSKYEIDEEAPDPWELLIECEAAQEK